MSKRHTANRRRTYGRRQHELHERVDRRADRRVDRTGRTGADASFDTLAYVDAAGADQPYGFAD